MISQLEALVGTGWTAVIAIFATLSFLAWWPAIAGVVISERPLRRKLPLFVLLALFPPASLPVLGVGIYHATPRPSRQSAPKPRVEARRQRLPRERLCPACV